MMRGEKEEKKYALSLERYNYIFVNVLDLFRENLVFSAEEKSVYSSVFYSLTLNSVLLWIYSESTGKPLGGSQGRSGVYLFMFLKRSLGC